MVRIVERVPLAPAWTGILLAASFFAIYVAFAYALGRVGEAWVLGQSRFWKASEFPWFELLCALMVGYLPAATAYGLRGALRDFQALQPALRSGDAEFRDQLREITSFDRTRLLGVGLFAVGIILFFQFLGFRYGPSSLWPAGRPGFTDPEFIWITLRNALLAWLVAQAFYIDAMVGRRFSRVGEDSVEVDLLDLGPLAPFARKGLRSVVVWIGLTILVSLGFLAPWTRDIPLGSLLLLVSVAVAALLLPVLGVHRRIQEAKREELARVRARIRERVREGAAPTGVGPLAAAPLSDLIAYEQRSESANTWPFDVPTLLRFGLYVALGVGSWVGGAIVERLLGTVLG
jgi:hypothetical protein